MKFFGLAPETGSIVGSPVTVKSPSLAYSIIFGSLSFGAVSTLAYSIWAFGWIRQEEAMYATTAAVYVGLAGLVLSRLVIAPRSWKRFPLLFALVFVVYAICWCAFWFGLKGKYRADLLGALAGLAAMTWLLQRAFGREDGFFRLFAVLFVLHSIGYYVGGELYAQYVGEGTGARLRRPAGRLLWGASHGLGFGAGLGYVLFYCQTKFKTRLPST